MSKLEMSNDEVLPFGYKIIHKDVSFSDSETPRVKQKFSTILIVNQNKDILSMTRNLVISSLESEI